MPAAGGRTGGAQLGSRPSTFAGVSLGHLLQVLVGNADLEQGRQQHPQPFRVRRSGELAEVGPEDEVLALAAR